MIKTRAFLATILILALFLPGTTLAVQQDKCQEFGYDYTAAIWLWNDEWINIYEAEGHATLTQGNEESIEWASEQEIAGIISMETCNYQVVEGGTEGIMNVHAPQDNIQKVFFCADILEEEPEAQVPEFGAIAAIIVLITAGAVIYRKRK